MGTPKKIRHKHTKNAQAHKAYSRFAFVLCSVNFIRFCCVANQTWTNFGSVTKIGALSNLPRFKFFVLVEWKRRHFQFRINSHSNNKRSDNEID